jgi:hypothetical protein
MSISPEIHSLTLFPDKAIELTGLGRKLAEAVITAHHYTHSVPSGKSIYVQFSSAIIVWSIPANKNIAKFILGWPGNVWELSRLYAPDGHDKNLLTRAISNAVSFIKHREHPDALVSYADPNANHRGGVYRAASWIYHGQSDRTRMYQRDGFVLPRRSFHSGSKVISKGQIVSSGWVETYQEGKYRFVKPLTRKARRAISSRIAINHCLSEQ